MGAVWFSFGLSGSGFWSFGFKVLELQFRVLGFWIEYVG